MSKTNLFSHKNSKQWIVIGCIVLLIFSLIIVGKLVGCGNSKDVNSLSNQKIDLTPTNELVLDIPASHYFPQYYKDAIETFKDQYKNVKVTVNRLGSRDNFPTDQYQKALNTELMAGSGPDVILTDYFTSDLYKTMDTGVFLNLSSIIEGDKDFKMDDYNSAIMNAGYYRGGQYIIPLSYTTQIFVADQTGLDKIGFDTKKVTNSTSFINEVSDCLPKAKENPSFTGICNKPILPMMLRSSGISLVDEKNKKVLPNEAAIRDFCKAYQPLYKTDYSDKTYSGGDYERYSQAITPFGYLSDTTWIVYWSLIKSKGDNPVSIAPTSVNGGMRATVFNGVAINSATPNQLNAWNFIKILLSNQINVMPGLGLGYPVDKMALKQHLKSYLDRTINWHFDKGEGVFERVDISVLTTQDIERFQATLDGITSCSLQCKPIEDLFKKCMEPYFKGEKDLDSCMKDLKRQLNLYISE
jgi:ABC-type sugar transport system, periplasmic component